MYINEPSIVTHIASGGTVFQFGFKWFVESDILVYKVDVGTSPTDSEALLPPEDYTIVGEASMVGGNVTIHTPLVEGDRITIVRSLPFIRTTDYATRGSFRAVTVNDDQDYQSYLIADLEEVGAYTVKRPISGGPPTEAVSFPEPGLNEEYIRWNLEGTKLINDTAPPAWRTETKAFRDETEGFRNETIALRDETIILRDNAITASDNSEGFSWDSEAESLTADSFANQDEDVEVLRFTSNGDGTFTSTPVPNTYSSYHWSEKTKLSNASLVYQGTWDASTGTYPTTRPDLTPLEAADLFIVDVAGTIETIEWKIGDWMIRNATNDGWGRIAKTLEWGTIQNVPENVSNALSRAGGTMTGQIKGVTPVAPEDLARKDYVDNAASSGSTPIGGIIMYSGLFVNIPSSWKICDGNNGTPNLVDKFILGTAIEIEVGATGGTNDAAVVAHTHTGPSHTHTGASHTHTISHNHSRGSMEISGALSARAFGSTGVSNLMTGGSTSGAFTTTTAGGSSYDSVEGTTNASSTNSIANFQASRSWSGSTSDSSNASSGSTTPAATGSSGTGATSSTGVSGTGANRPAFVTLAYIQRIS